MPGTFTLSFDFELAWGEFYRREVDVERMLAARAALPALLRLLDRYAIPATFAVVGHLLLEGCDGHRSMPRTEVTWRPGDWYRGDPKTDEASDPAWYAASLVRTIAGASSGHDIGAHGFSHVPFDDPGVGLEVACAELSSCARLLREGGYPGASFVYPLNRVKYVELLKKNGFRCFRAVDDRWYNRRSRPVRRASHLLDQALAVTPPTGAPRETAGIVETPSSMLFLSRQGIRRHLPMRSRVSRAHRGLRRAAETASVFHLWLHVEDLVPDTTLMLDGLAAVLTEARRLDDGGAIAVRTMRELRPDSAEVTV